MAKLKHLLILTCFVAFTLSAKTTTDTQLCQAIKSDNHALVKAKLKPLKETYETHKCFNKTLLEHADKSPKTKEYLMRHLPYETIAKEAKDGRRVL